MSSSWSASSLQCVFHFNSIFFKVLEFGDFFCRVARLILKISGCAWDEALCLQTLTTPSAFTAGMPCRWASLRFCFFSKTSWVTAEIVKDLVKAFFGLLCEVPWQVMREIDATLWNACLYVSLFGKQLNSSPINKGLSRARIYSWPPCIIARCWVISRLSVIFLLLRSA